MTAIERWCRVTVFRPDGTVAVNRVLEGPANPDLGVVDVVARLALLATRLGGRIDIAEVSPAMEELFELAGLPFEVERQTESGEQALGVQEVQEETHRRDLPV